MSSLQASGLGRTSLPLHRRLLFGPPHPLPPSPSPYLHLPQTWHPPPPRRRANPAMEGGEPNKAGRARRTEGCAGGGKREFGGRSPPVMYSSRFLGWVCRAGVSGVAGGGGCGELALASARSGRDVALRSAGRRKPADLPSSAHPTAHPAPHPRANKAVRPCFTFTRRRGPPLPGHRPCGLDRPPFPAPIQTPQATPQATPLPTPLPTPQPPATHLPPRPACTRAAGGAGLPLPPLGLAMPPTLLTHRFWRQPVSCPATSSPASRLLTAAVTSPAHRRGSVRRTRTCRSLREPPPSAAAARRSPWVPCIPAPCTPHHPPRQHAAPPHAFLNRSALPALRARSFRSCKPAGQRYPFMRHPFVHRLHPLDAVAHTECFGWPPQHHCSAGHRLQLQRPALSSCRLLALTDRAL
jgi:hypothetical protein